MSKYKTLRELINTIREDELEKRLPPEALEPISDNPKILGRTRRNAINRITSSDQK